MEIEPRHPVRRQRHGQLAPLDQQRFGSRGLALGQMGEHPVERGVGPAIGGHDPGFQTMLAPAPVIPLRVQHQHVQIFFEQLDEGQKGVPPRLAFIKIVRQRVGGGDDHDLAGEQRLE